MSHQGIPQPHQQLPPQQPQSELATHYSGPYLNEYLPFDEQCKTATSQNGSPISISFTSSGSNNFHYIGTISVTPILPELKIANESTVWTAWPWDAIPLSIDTITLTTSSIESGQVGYTITGEQIAEVLQWWRNFDNIKNEVMGNIPELTTFSKHIPSYPSTIRLPVFWNNDHPFPRNLCTEDININVVMKKPSDLLRLRLKINDDVLDLSHGDIKFVENTLKRVSIEPNYIDCEVEYYVSNCSDFVNDPSNQLYKNRLLPTFTKYESPVDGINRSYTCGGDNINKNVLGFMWHLEPVYLDTKKNQMNIHAYGNYSLDPLNGSKHDPVSYTHIDIVRANGSNEPTIKLKGTSSRIPVAKGLSESMKIGHHIHTFGTNPFEGLKNPGKDIKKFKIVCTSSDQFVSTVSVVNDADSDFDALLDGKNLMSSRRDSPVKLNLEEIGSSNSLLHSHSKLEQYGLPKIQILDSIAYKLVVYMIVSTEMNIDNGKVKFK